MLKAQQSKNAQLLEDMYEADLIHAFEQTKLAPKPCSSQQEGLLEERLTHMRTLMAQKDEEYERVVELNACTKLRLTEMERAFIPLKRRERERPGSTTKASGRQLSCRSRRVWSPVRYTGPIWRIS